MTCQIRFSFSLALRAREKTALRRHFWICVSPACCKNRTGKSACSTKTFAPSDSAALGRAATVVRDRRHVLDVHDVQTGRGERAHGGFAPRARALHAYFDRFHPVLVARHSRGGNGGLLGRIGRALTRSLEANRSGGRPGYGASIRPADRNDRVVERGLDVRHAVRDDALLPLLLEFFLLLR